MNWPSCAANSTDVPPQRARPDDDAVVERARQSEPREMRARRGLLRRQEFAHRPGIEQARDALAGGRLRSSCVAALMISLYAASACDRRNVTTAGVAPMSLMTKLSLPTALLALKLSSTACQMSRKPRADVCTSMRQSSLPGAGTISTSRLPEPTTPRSVGARAAAAGLACERELERFHGAFTSCEIAPAAGTGRPTSARAP